MPDIFISLKQQQEKKNKKQKTTSDIVPSLHKFKRRFLLTSCVAMTPGLT